MNAALDLDALRDRYDEDGFVVIRGLFTPASFAELQANLERYVREVVPALPKDQAFFDDYSRPETLRKMQSWNRPVALFAKLMNEGPNVGV